LLTNLLAIGCPPETARDIFEGRVADDFRARLREVTLTFQPRFWDLLAAGENLDKMFKTPALEAQTATWKGEHQRLLTTAEAALGRRPEPASPERPDGFTHVSPAKQTALLEMQARHLAIWRNIEAELKTSKADKATRDTKLREHQTWTQAERRALFTDAEWAEFELRITPQAAQVRELRGYPATPDELRALALTLREFETAHPQPKARDPQRPTDDPTFQAQQDAHETQRKTFFTTRLGEAGSAAFERASDPRYHTLVRLARRLDLSPKVATQWLELQTAAQAQARQTRENTRLAEATREAALRAIRAETERTLQAAVGTRGWGAYQRHAGDWLEQLAP
jgi:hypothetical protein